MIFELFVDQPCLDLYKGIRVTKETELSYKNERVEQLLKDLKLDTILDDEGTNGVNTFKSKSHIAISLNEGDILLFDEKRGYYLPPYPKTSLEKAVEDLGTLKAIKLTGTEETE